MSTDDPFKRDTVPGFVSPTAEEIALARAAIDGPGEDLPAKDRPTLEVCPSCHAEGMIPPHLADNVRHAMVFWLANGSPKQAENA